MSERGKRICRLALLVSGLGVAALLYLILVRLTGFGIPCLFHEVTGLQCPGCGMTHAAVALSRGEVLTAMGHNLMLPVYGLYLGWMAIYGGVRYVRGEKHPMLFGPNWVHIAMLVLVIVFGILRNIF